MLGIVTRTDLLVVGAGPYAYAAAAHARDHGIDTHVVGDADGVLARADADGHVSCARARTGTSTAAASTRSRRTSRIAASSPRTSTRSRSSVFLDHTDWFAERKGLDVDERLVAALTSRTAPSSRRWRTARRSPPTRCWPCPASGTSSTSPSGRPPCRRAPGHTSDLVSFDDLAGARVAIIGGRQSAYEWAALLCDHGAERGRRGAPARDAGVREGQLGLRRRVRRPDARAPRLVARPVGTAATATIAREFWEVGRLTLEHWLVPRLAPGCRHQPPRLLGRRVRRWRPATRTSR